MSERNLEQRLSDLTTASKVYQRQIPEGSVGLPFGKVVPGQEFMSMIYGFHDPRWFLGKAHELVEKPEPGWTYAWPDKNDNMTAARLRSGAYRVVYAHELKDKVDAEIRLCRGSNGIYVMWGRHILVRMPQQVKEELYIKPAILSIARLARHGEGFQEEIEVKSRGRAVGSFEVDVARE